MPTAAAAHPAAGLPSALHPPFEVALARAAETIPLPKALPGGCQYEPKWDGFRLVIVRADGHTSLWSRQGKDLTASFPDIAAAASVQVPPGFVVDGEAVVWQGGRLDFDALQRRLITRGGALTRLARKTPATFVAFDLLAAAGQDVQQHPLRARRALLEELAGGWEGLLQLSPASSELEQAREWFDVLPSLGIEGVVVKGLGQPYTAGQRSWLKVKHRDTVEVVCAAVLGPIERPEQLIVGLPVEGVLRITGRSTPLRTAAARALGEQLRAPTGPHPWPALLPGTALERFNGSTVPVPLTLIEPIVVEVSADVALAGHSFRHPVRFLRTRPELRSTDVQQPPKAS